jgi:hypothetical protein
MPDLRLSVDVFSPHYVKTLRYTGDHPSRTLKIIPNLIKSTFKITSTNFYEDEIKWDKSAPETIEFFGQWRGREPKDVRTNFWVKVKVIGKQNAKDKKGTVTIYIHPYMITTIPYSNFLDRALAYTYSHFFYGEQRRKYITKDLIYLKRFEDLLKQELGIR